jgi:glycine/D-amino acid oxidase-like deaminating enzyme/nitrite reductase/ring-hydroxylating ferredoxin subunit
VGAGISGLTTAYLLAKAGLRVTVVDEKPVGGGETGRTSAHLASILDDRFSHLERVHGEDATRLCYQSHASAIDLIERIVRDEHLECEFARVDGYLFLGRQESGEFLDRELAAARRAGVAEITSVEEPAVGAVKIERCLRAPNQARFHPMKYLHGLAECLQRLGVQIACGHRVRDLAGDGPVCARLDNGPEVRAAVGVAATNVPTPINNWVGIYTKQAAYRTYVVGLSIPPRAVGDSLYWDCDDPYHYARLHVDNGRTVLIVGGEDHKTGQGAGARDTPNPFDRLERWAREWCPAAGEVVSRWSGQVSEPEDGIAFIGRVPTAGHRACYVITGDSGMGLTHGTLGAMLVSDQILGRKNPWADLYDPARRPTRSIATFVRENANAAGQLADYVTPGDAASAEEIPPDGGAVLRRGLLKVAAYRDPSGALHECSAVCPHLKCLVRWNAIEKTWDCPCHGSRFDAKGKLIIGPAIDDLSEA